MTTKQYSLEALKDFTFQFSAGNSLLVIRFYDDKENGLSYNLTVNDKLVISGAYFYNEITFYETTEFKLYFKNIVKVDNYKIPSYYDLPNYNLFCEVYDE